jgi:serine/threonine protein kinase
MNLFIFDFNLFSDLKLEHAIVCSAGHIRLVDYGLGRFLKTPDETCHTYCGTYSYMAPEVKNFF